MGVYTDWVDGYLLESTYGTSTIVAAGTQTNSLGILSKEAIHPSPKSEIIFGEHGDSTKEVSDGALWKGPEDLRGTYTIVLQNGILLYLAMGLSSTAATVHTITPSTTASMPSICIQHDLTGTASDWGTTYTGVKVMNLELNCDFQDQYLWGVVDWVAQAATNAGFVSTNAPVLPTTATATPYTFNNMTATFDGNSIADNLLGIQLKISPNLKIWRDGSRTIPEPLDGDKMNYEFNLTWSPSGSTLWDEAAATGNTKNVVLKWTKSANDYIQITMTDWQVLYHEQKTPTVGEALIEEVYGVPRKISIEVKDAVTSTYYGE